MKALILSSLVLLTSVVQATDLPQMPFLVTSGKSEIDIKPTEATIKFRVFIFNKNAEQGLEAFTLKSLKLKQFFTKYKIKRNCVEAEELEKDIVRERSKSGRCGDVIGYEFERDYSVKLVDLSLYSSFITELYKIPNVRLFGSYFDNDKYNSLLFSDEEKKLDINKTII